MNDISSLVSFLTKSQSQKPSCLQGWGLVRVEGVEKYNTWTHQWLIVENGALVWHVDDLKSAVNGAVVLIKSEVVEDGVIDQTDARILRFSCIMENELVVTIELGLSQDDIHVWKSIIEQHMQVSDDSTKIKYITEILRTEDSFEEGTAAATMQVHLKGKPHTIVVTPEDDISAMADKFIEDNKLKPEIKSRIETELLKTQVDACLIHESKLRRLLNWTRRRACDRVLLEQRCFLAEQSSAALVDSMAQIEQCAAQVQTKTAALRSELREKSEKMDSMSDLLEAADADMNRLSDANQQMSEAIAKLHAERTQNEEQIRSLEVMLHAQGKREEAHNVHVCSLEAEIAHLQGQAAHDKLDAQAAIEKLHVTTNKYKELSSKYDLLILTNKRTALRIRAGDKSVSSDMTEVDGEEVRAMKLKYEERVKVLRHQVAAHDGLKAEMQKKYDDAVANLQSTTLALRRGEEEIISLRSENKEMRNRLRSSSPTKVTQQMSDENYSLRQQMGCLRADIAKIKEHAEDIETGAVCTIKQVIIDITEGHAAHQAQMAHRNSNDSDQESHGQEQEHGQLSSEEMPEYLQDMVRNLTNVIDGMKEEQPMPTLSSSYDMGMEGNSPGPSPGQGQDREGLFNSVGQFDNPCENKENSQFNSPEQQQQNKKLMPDFTGREVHYDLVTPIVEDRLLRSVYCRYVSDISGGMSITRMGRFAKEFGIVPYSGSAGVAGNALHTSANRPPYLTSGEVDMIYLNACKVEADATVHSAWEEHMGLGGDTTLYGSATKPKPSPFNVRHASDIIGGPSGNAPKSSGAKGSKGHISPHQLSISQFVVCMKAIATRLYASLIEQQTGTILECLPTRQREVATAAALEVLLKKKILPVAEAVGLVPWPLIFMDQTLTSINNSQALNNILCGKMDIMIELFQRYGSDFTIAAPQEPVTDHQKLLDDRVDAIKSPTQKLNLSKRSSPAPIHHHNPNKHIHSVCVHALTYKQASQMAHDVGIIPGLVKEAEFFSQFEEIVLWCQTDTHLILTALSNELLSYTTLFQEEVAWRHTQQAIKQHIKKFGEKKTQMSVSHGPSQFPSSHASQLVIGMASLFILIISVGVQAYSDMHPETRVERLFEWIEQSAHFTPGLHNGQGQQRHGQNQDYGMNTPSPRRNFN